MSGEKTEEPTEKKLEDAREKGEAPKSQDVNAAAGMMAGTLLLMMSSWICGDHLRKLFAIANSHAWLVQSDDETLKLMYDMAAEGILMSLPYLAASIVTGFIASFAQVGVQISFEPITPNFDKINPGSGIKKLFSVKSVVEFIKMVFKAVALGSVIYVIIRGLLPLVVGTATQIPMTLAQIGWMSIGKLMAAATIVFIVIGPLDWALQVWLFKRDQKMTKDEVKREHKESEGDPEIKSKRKQLARELANSAPQKRVPGSNVVVTNPTHYAVAIQYLPGRTPLPVVVAKGVDAEAAVIRELAAAHKVPVVANPPLARALYKVTIDEPVPEALFEAVAAVLRWVSLVDGMSASLGRSLPLSSDPERPRG
jgi:type III secretion protein U